MAAKIKLNTPIRLKTAALKLQPEIKLSAAGPKLAHLNRYIKNARTQS
jgi:hypothetical protein